MNTLARSCTKPNLSLQREQYHVTVVFLGHDDYHADFSETTDLRQIKLQALAYFGIVSDAVGKYILRYQGGNCRDDQRLAELGGRELTFTLVSVEETGRFGEALFLR